MSGKEAVFAQRARTEMLIGIDNREALEERTAKLAGGVAVIKVGAATEVEMKERRRA